MFPTKVTQTADVPLTLAARRHLPAADASVADPSDGGRLMQIVPDREAALRTLDQACGRLVTLSERPAQDGPRVFHRAVAAIHDICDALVDCEVVGIDSSELRSRVDPARQVHARSPFTRRLQEWPRGYPGDFETIEWLWSAENRGDTPLSRALEHYALTAAIAQQHRNKVAYQAACVLEAMRRHRYCRVLSLACGSSPDLRSIAKHVTPEAEFVLCDSDQDALRFSAEGLGSLAERCRLVHGMVPRVLREIRPHGPYHLVFAGGLFDYLGERLVQRTLSTIWTSLLAPGGRIVFTNIATGNPFRVWLEYLADWKLIERSEGDVRRICENAGINAPVTLSREPTGLAILASIEKV